MSVSEADVQAYLRGLAGRRLLCIGDLMLDRFVYGTVDRISPEAPIPVIRAEREEVMLGGAGNVARNLTSLGARCALIGVCGEDAEHQQVQRLAEESEVVLRLSVDPGRRTTAKWRFVGGHQQLLRADFESAEPVGDSIAEEVLAHFSRELPGADAVIISDYGKGLLGLDLLQTVIEQANWQDTPVVVDPKGNDYRRYQGADVVTPNQRELSEAAHDRSTSDREGVEAAARWLIQTNGLGAVVATLGPNGVAVVRPGADTSFRTSQAKEVFDVSGAGDTVVAAIAGGLAQSWDLLACADIANVAAGVVVSKLGTSAVTPAELLSARRSAARATSDAKLLSGQALKETISAWRSQGQRIGFTNGCFDLLHPGHVHLLEQARAECDRLVVGLNSDASVTRLKGPGRPVYDEPARATLLASLACVDAISVFEDDTPLDLIRSILPDVLVKGADYTRETVVGHEIVEAAGGRVFLADLKAGFSTTRTVEMMAR